MGKKLDVVVLREGRVGILRTDGYITDIEAQKIVDASQPLIDEGVTHLLLNLERSGIINSFGISILFDLIDKTRDCNGQLGFCHVAPVIAKTFKIMGLLQVAKIYETEKEAIRDLNS